MIKINCEQRSEAWYQNRLGRFTASIASDLIAGLSTQTYKDLIIDIAGELITGESEETYTSPDMERGIELEPVACNEYESIFGEVEHTGLIIPDEDTEFHEWIGISPDLIKEPGMGEIKCPKRKTHLNYIKNNVLPNIYKPQVQFQLFVTEYEYCDFISYYPKTKLFIYRVYPDKEMFKLFEDRLRIAISDVNEFIKTYNNFNSF